MIKTGKLVLLLGSITMLIGCASSSKTNRFIKYEERVFNKCFQAHTHGQPVDVFTHATNDELTSGFACYEKDLTSISRRMKYHNAYHVNAYTSFMLRIAAAKTSGEITGNQAKALANHLRSEFANAVSNNDRIRDADDRNSIIGAASLAANLAVLSLQISANQAANRPVVCHQSPGIGRTVTTICN